MIVQHLAQFVTGYVLNKFLVLSLLLLNFLNWFCSTAYWTMGHCLSTLKLTGGGEGGGGKGVAGGGGGGQTWKARLTSVVVLPCGSAVFAWVALYAL